ncbi:hypothetical protein BDF20DRAFT_846329 [Mycotypha africana]|uniref:uncharacterized protein n=1 Tax=Mycotypha africana TaxID=64632 RepID=UPI00230015F4|nr:uncharacterized protein BDF20DRAFT_846329 [Mycotypha africana]KAI8991778.1 hypothetical protein BDF20DRAFT_846329 [Mycotypha africana]
MKDHVTLYCSHGLKEHQQCIILCTLSINSFDTQRCSLNLNGLKRNRKIFCVHISL